MCHHAQLAHSSQIRHHRRRSARQRLVIYPLNQPRHVTGKVSDCFTCCVVKLPTYGKGSLKLTDAALWSKRVGLPRSRLMVLPLEQSVDSFEAMGLPYESAKKHPQYTRFRISRSRRAGAVAGSSGELASQNSCWWPEF